MVGFLADVDHLARRDVPWRLRGRLVTYENVGRKLTENAFVGLVAGGWIGTGAAQSATLEEVIRDIVQNGKAVVLAVRSKAASAA